jgi:penicillin-binding protein 1C
MITRSRLLWIGLLAIRVCELGLLALIIAGIAGVAVFRYYSQDLPDTASLASHRPFETTRIYARDGETLLYEVFDGGQRTLIPLADIPWAVQAATIAVEDAGFYTNPGVDLRGIVRAIYLNREGEVRSGGSTITQQLARNVLLPPGERTEQSYRRKIREAILAFRISREFSKDQILSMYLNEIYYGNMAYGIEAAAHEYLGRGARTLGLAEAALLAGLPQSPTELNPLLYPEQAKARQKIVLDLMVKAGFIDQAQANAAFAETIRLRPGSVDIRYPHWVFYVRDLLEREFGPDLLYHGGLRVTTTLDPRLQEIAMERARDEVAALADRNVHNAAVVVMDPTTAEILAMVGSVDYNNPAIDGQVNVALAVRQPGSALKPLVYAAALDADWTPATVIWDTPTDFGGGYRPENYDGTFRGPQRLRYALAGSLNIPAVKALQYVGLDRFLEIAHAMGITTLRDRERYGLAVALGAGEVRLLDLTTAYTAFAHGGLARPPVALLRVTTNQGETLLSAEPQDGRPVFGRRSAQIAYLISDILSDNAARAPVFGPESVMRLADDRPAAVKTGTSNDFKDSWAVGYTPDLVVGVWVGNNDNTPMQEVAGANGAGRIWRAVMELAHVDVEPRPFERPEGIVERPICASTGRLADGCPDQILERFLADVSTTDDGSDYITVTLGGDGSCLATEFTPPEEQRTAVFLRPPPDARDWLAGAAIPQPPTEPCPAPGVAQQSDDIAVPRSVAAIVSPRASEAVGGTVSIWGSAAGPYVLSIGEGENPSTWVSVAEGVGGVTNALLGAWNTESLAPGSYTLRLLVALPGNPQQDQRVVVRLAPDELAVRLILPTSGTVVRDTRSLLLAAETSGPAERVELLVDDQLVFGGDAPTITFEWTALGHGQHTIVAEAIGQDGTRVRSQPSIISVGEPSP